MKPKLLILSVYPAPYRAELFDRLSEVFDPDVFFESSGGDQRDSKWFRQGSYHTLDKTDDLRIYRGINLKAYSAVLVYDYASKEGCRLIANCKRQRIPYIINCDGVMMEKHGNFVRDAIKRYLIKGAAGYFASGENAKRYFVRFGADEGKIFTHTFSELEDKDILHEPVSTEEKKRIRNCLNLPEDKKIAIAVGRFIPLKRYDKLIKAWKAMPEEYVLLLIGGGSESDNYRRIISENGIQNVLLKDFVMKDVLFDYYKASDIFVHPTSYDVWGLVVNEAMACALPVVVSDHCVAGLELIKNQINGYLVPMGNDREMCERVVEILGDPRKHEEMSHNSLKSIRPYTMSNMAQAQITAIKKTIERD